MKALRAFPAISLNTASELPLYKQLAESIGGAIRSGVLGRGERLPPTRELAGQLGLNRTTVSAAYSILEEAGLLEGQVGRGSFVAFEDRPATRSGLDWETLLPPLEGFRVPGAPPSVNFASSRPAEDFFPLSQFRRLAKEVIDGPEAAEILQLGSSYGYQPLRRYLLAEAVRNGIAGPTDDVIVTNGCQQALDLLARVLAGDGSSVLLEDPVYGGLLGVFRRTGAHILPVPVGDTGVNVTALESLISQRRPRLLVLTPDFQNPTGSTLGLEQRKAILALAQGANLLLVENGIYRDLRYCGEAIPSLKQLDDTGNTITIGSYSKIAFPGLRVGWVIAPRPVIARLAEAKQSSDLHSDQLSQAVLLRFAESGELARHLAQTKRSGLERLRAVLESCEQYLPFGTKFTRPQGGMSLWVELRAPLLTEELLKMAEERGVSFLPGAYFSVLRDHRRSFRISFGGLAPAEISQGVKILGEVMGEQLVAHRAKAPDEPMAALV